MYRSKDSHRVLFGTVAMVTLLAPFISLPIFFCVIRPIRFPFLFGVDSTHILAFGKLREVAYNIPSVIVFVFDAAVAVVLATIVTMVLVLAWQRFVIWGNAEMEEALEEERKKNAKSNAGKDGNIVRCSTVEQEIKLEPETLKMPESKVLQEDLNSL